MKKINNYIQLDTKNFNIYLNLFKKQNKKLDYSDYVASGFIGTFEDFLEMISNKIDSEKLKTLWRTEND